MIKDTINLFMWGYQQHFRVMLEHRVKEIFTYLGIEEAPEIFLVGIKTPNSTVRHPVCIEPEDGNWHLDLFSDVLGKIETEIEESPLQGMFFTDERTTRQYPENIRKSSTVKVIRELLETSNFGKDFHFFLGDAVFLDGYYVVPIIQISALILEKFPKLDKNTSDTRWQFYCEPSLIHACLTLLLRQASEDLKHPDAGNSFTTSYRANDEIVRNAASNFMRSICITIDAKHVITDLFERFNLISSLMYEGTKGTGKFLLAHSEHPSIEYLIRFKNKIPFSEPRWARKILQMAQHDISIIADPDYIYGLGRINFELKSEDKSIFIINFLDHYHWEVCLENKIILRSRYGKANLPKDEIKKELFINNCLRMFPQSVPQDADLLWRLTATAIQQSHGSMLIVAEDAEMEAQRLQMLGTLITPIRMTEELLQRASYIDGTIILDPHGNCYAIGVILDGEANFECTPSRGSRFNSGVRYVRSSQKKRLAIIVSEDHTVDIIPKLRPQIKKNLIAENISLIESASSKNYHYSRNWLDEHRFYLNNAQCNQINVALNRIEALVKEDRGIFAFVNRFSVNPDMDESYLTE